MINTDNPSGIVVDDVKVKRIIRRIMVEETRNIKSQDKSDTHMVKEIKKLIEEEVECY